MKLSPSTWSVIDLLRLRFGVQLFVYDAALAPVGEDGPAPAAAALMDEPGMRDRCRAVLATDDARSPRSVMRGARTVALTVGREVLGVLVATSPERHTRELREEELAAMDAAAQIASVTVERDVAQAREVGHERESARRLQGILRFMRVVTEYTTEAELMNAVVQAATVWFDLDCRIYVRTTPDAFRLFAALPGYAAGDLPSRLPAARARELAQAGGVSSPAELDELGWTVTRGKALVIPFGTHPDWLLVIGDTITPEVDVTFVAMAHVLTCALRRGADDREARWRGRLADASADRADRTLRDLLQALSDDLGGAHVRLSMDEAGGVRTLGSAGNELTARVVTQSLKLGDRTVRLEVAHMPDGPPFEHLASMSAWLHILEPWLRGAMLADRPAPEAALAPFERRIQDEIERAKRGSAGLGVVLVRADRAVPADTQEPLMEALKPALRASDLTGRVRDGMLAIVLVHARAGAADSVVARLRRRLTAAGSGFAVRIGHAMISAECATADALIRCALTDMDA